MEKSNNMNSKPNKYLIIMGAICTIIPLNILLIGSGINNAILVYVPMVIGYMLYLVQYKKYSEKQKNY